MWLLANVTNWSDPTSVLITAGPGGLLVGLILLKKLAPFWVLEDKERQIKLLQDENTALKGELRDTHQTVEDRIIPALVRATDLLGRGGPA